MAEVKNVLLYQTLKICEYERGISVTYIKTIEMTNQETDRIEYKERLDDQSEKLEVVVCAFLNTKGGEIFYGIKDDGSIIGVDDADSVQTKIASRLTDNIQPNTAGLIDVFTEDREGKALVMVKVASGIYTPYYLSKYGRVPKGCYYRLGSSSRQMPEDMIERMMTRRHPISLQSKIARNQDLTFRQLKIYYEEKGISLNQHFAQNLGFLTKDGKYNEIAYMFSDENRVSIRLAKWGGTDKLNLIQNEEFGDTCLITAMNRVLERLNTANITQARKTFPLRIEKSYVNKDALREAVINAFVHNDYADNGDTPIFEIYADRFEITSYGDLRAWIEEEDFFTGISKPRNPEIMRIFKDLDFADEVGSGIPEIVEIFGREAFRFSRSITRLSLRYDTSMIADKTARESPNSALITPRKHPDNALKIIAALRDDPHISRPGLSALLGMTEDQVKWNLNKLKKQGVIRRIGPAKGGYWEIIAEE